MARFCGQCGFSIMADAKFCPGCGASVSLEAPPTTVLSAVPIASVAPPAAVAVPPTEPQAYPPAEIMWHYTAAGAAQGPIAESALRQLLPSLPTTTKFWNPSLPSWQSAEEVGLRVAAAASVSASPYPPAASAPTPHNPPAYAPVSSAPVSPSGGYGKPQAHAAYAAGPAQPPCATSAPVAGGPMPPSMHWAVVLILSFVTGGLAGFVWWLKQALFVKKIDPASKVVVLWVVTLIAMVIQLVLMLGAATSRSAAAAVTAASLSMLLNLVIVVVVLIAMFSMRKSLVTYYNSVEPIGLQLSGVMTFFFNILYFQYHFSRIANWKQTGRLI